ncbi:MAG: protein phosphatase CheZ [Parvibaculaceae bacterium]|nr:protein phosphatase CheZ [Parvibaculaceae bacterium]HBM87314.1 chemotaxis protein [Rhodobiaceae bacterium]|tara:strand:+ start:1319 stop:2005 length:687 start_codon:yes stop_codon:yes gene_type:complete
MSVPEKSVDSRLDEVAGHIRDMKTDSLSLPDILNLAEIMVGSMQGFFGHVDTAIYKELTEISDFIDTTRTEIGRLQPGNLKDKHIPEAGLELEAIVQSTETATNTIMEQAELIMSADPDDMPAYHDTVQGAVMEIFEACSFQDITGQRISKVVSTLVHIETKISTLAEALGSALSETIEDEEETAEEKRKRELILNGPALEGQGIDQSDVDDILSDGASQDDIDALFD